MEIVSYHPDYAKNFKSLNEEWLKKYFSIEAHDEEVLGQPEKYILDPGGEILFVKEAHKIIATLAFIKIKDGTFELTKMAVHPDFRGKKIGQKLMEFALKFAKKKQWHELIIYSNRKLENAIHIYKKYGFKEIPIGKNNPYARGDIKMRFQIS